MDDKKLIKKLEDVIVKTLRKEGGASGLKPLKKAIESGTTKDVINELFSPETAKAVSPTEFKYTGVLGGSSGKLDEFGILLYHIKQQISTSCCGADFKARRVDV